jgi:hypothetical protein
MSAIVIIVISALVCLVGIAAVIGWVIIPFMEKTIEGLQDTCVVDDTTNPAEDIALMKCFQDIARDEKLLPHINEKARIALLGILEEYVPEEDDDAV